MAHHSPSCWSTTRHRHGHGIETLGIAMPHTPESVYPSVQTLTAWAVLLHDDGWQREDGSEYDEARSAYTPIDIDGAGRTGKSGAYLSLRERQFAELMVRARRHQARTRVDVSGRWSNGYMGVCVAPHGRRQTPRATTWASFCSSYTRRETPLRSARAQAPAPSRTWCCARGTPPSTTSWTSTRVKTCRRC